MAWLRNVLQTARMALQIARRSFRLLLVSVPWHPLRGVSVLPYYLNTLIAEEVRI